MRKILFVIGILFWGILTGYTQEIDTLQTIESFRKTGDFYSMNYQGDYSDLLETIDHQFLYGGSTPIDGIHCSLFTALNNPENRIFGRNFDNPLCDVLVAKYSPPDGYESVAFSRMSDFGYPTGTEFEDLNYQQKLPLLQAPYFPPDGINEHGVTTGLAWVPSVPIVHYPEKDTIFITHLVRKILDHAQNIDEAIQIANSYNVWDGGSLFNLQVSHHLLVGDGTGESVILEYHDGAYQVIPNSQPWQVITNIYVYGVPLEELMASSWRYNAIYSSLEGFNGDINWEQGMEILSSAYSSTQWSAVYDMLEKSVYISIRGDYENIAYAPLENFDILNYGHFDLSELILQDENDNGLWEAGESANIIIGLSSEFNAYGVTATISTDDPDVTILNDQATFGEMLANEVSDNNNSPFEISLSENIVSHSIPFTLTISTDYGHEYATTFEVFAGLGDILLIDDDGGENYESYYTETLNSLGLIPHPVNQFLSGGIHDNLYDTYSAIIWLTGNASENTLTEEDQSKLANFLDNGGSLFISGQNIGDEISNTSFFVNYLHSQNYLDDWNGTSMIKGVDSDPIGDGITAFISGGDGANNQNSPGGVTPTDDAFQVFGYGIPLTSNSVRYDGEYKMVYLAFGFEAINSSEMRAEIMNKILSYLGVEVDIENSNSLTVPPQFILKQNYPNPFNPSTTITFTIPSNEGNTRGIKLAIYDLSGKLIKTLVEGQMEEGYHSVTWDGKNDHGESVASGLYFYRLKTGNIIITKQCLLIK